MSQEQTAHGKLLSYSRGWIKGAGCISFTDAEMRDADFRKGWDDGRIARKLDYEKACNKYGSELSVIKAQ